MRNCLVCFQNLETVEAWETFGLYYVLWRRLDLIVFFKLYPFVPAIVAWVGTKTKGVVWDRLIP